MSVIKVVWPVYRSVLRAGLSFSHLALTGLSHYRNSSGFVSRGNASPEYPSSVPGSLSLSLLDDVVARIIGTRNLFRAYVVPSANISGCMNRILKTLSASWHHVFPISVTRLRFFVFVHVLCTPESHDIWRSGNTVHVNHHLRPPNIAFY